MPYTALSDACGSAPRRTAAIPAENLWDRTPLRSPSLCPLLPNVNLNECQPPWQALQPTMAIGGINGALDFGPLASGVGGEGTGKVRCYRARSSRAHTEWGILKCCPSALACTI